MNAGVAGASVGQADAIHQSTHAVDGEAWTRIYRTIRNEPDLFGLPGRAQSEDTVAVAEIDGTLYFGMNSLAWPLGYTDSDFNAAVNAREEVLARYPAVASRGNEGAYPRDAFFHAEATALLRVARARGGSLENMEFEVFVDREMCWSCDAILPLLAESLGNPQVTFIDTQTGQRSTLHNGRWLSAHGR